jgi:hypothetical protein
MTTEQDLMITVLTELRSKAAFTNCGFSDFEIPGKFAVHFPFEMPCSTEALTDAIKEATRIYRESWILPLIDALIAHTKGEISLEEIRRTLL